MKNIGADTVAELGEIPIAIVSIQTRVDVAFQIIWQLANGILDFGLRNAQLLFEVLVLLVDPIHFFDCGLNFTITLVDLPEWYIDQVFEACDCWYSLLD